MQLQVRLAGAAEPVAQQPAQGAATAGNADRKGLLEVTFEVGAQAIESATWGENEGGRSLAVDPTEQAALKTRYLVTRGLDPKGTGQARWTMRWKPALNAFAVTFADRMPAAENL